MNPFQSLRDYEEFVYTLRQRFSIIDASTLVVARRGKRTATLQGEIAHSYSSLFFRVMACGQL